MKILTTLLATVVSILFAGSSFSGESIDFPFGWKPAWNRLATALTSPQMGMYAGDREDFSGGAWVIFAQKRDGASTVRYVEALDTVYLLSDQNKDNNIIPAMLTFEMDKTNSRLPLLGYKLDLDSMVGVARFDPTGLPPIDFQYGWKLVKDLMSEEFSIHTFQVTLASVGVFYAIEYPDDALVSFNVKRDDDPSEFCWEYVYNPVTKQAWKAPFTPPCWFDMDYEGDYCGAYGDSTICLGLTTGCSNYDNPTDCNNASPCHWDGDTGSCIPYWW